ncbi:ribonuclease R [Utexia brackfieldae]
MKDPFFERESEKYDSPIASRELILSYLKEIGAPASLDNIAKAMSLDGEEQKVALHRRLRAMERDGQLVFTRRKCYALPEKFAMIKGSVIGHRDGFGFLRVEGVKEDYYLPPDQMRLVLHGDVVLAQPLINKYKGKQEARIVRILEPRNNLIVGRYFIEQEIGFVVPDDGRLNFDILVAEKPDKTVRMGAVVVVELIKRPERRQKAMGKIKEILGENMETDLAIEIAVRNHDIPHQLPDAVLEQVAHFSEEVPQTAKNGRVDLRDLPLVTIDGEDARDFDDAVYCQKKRGGGWRLWVAIADVSYYVRPQTPLDKDACSRGTSVYFPSRVIPMLPEVLSNGLCSLNPQVDRLCMVCEMSISAKGKLTAAKFYEAVMNSHARLTYTKVAKMLKGDAELREQYAALVPDLENLYALFKVLDQTRQERGAIGFESPEPKFIFNADKRIERVEVAERNDAHKIIEECMILANVAAAKFVDKAKVPALYRIHDIPDSERVANLRTVLSELGSTLTGSEKPSPKDIAQLLDKTADRPDHEMIQTLVLRSMKQAVYDPENRGHFGLALDSYAHFTSPIRRYPDLLLHRAIKWLLAHQAEQESQTGGYLYSMEEMLYLGQQCSMAERRADEAVRDVVDWLKCDFMQDHVGEVYAGIIASLTNFGFFVRLDDLYIDGLVHVSSLENDYYSYDASRHRLIGEASGYVYRLGDRVKVKVESVNLDDHKIDLVLIDSEKKPKRLGKTAKQREKASDKPVVRRAKSNKIERSSKIDKKRKDSRSTSKSATKKRVKK